MMTTNFVGIITMVLALYLLIRYIAILFYRKINKVPDGPVGLPIIGSLLSMINNRKFYTILSQNYGKLCSYNLGLQRIICINDPDIVKMLYCSKKELTRKSIVLPHKYMTFGDYNGRKWFKRRKIISSQLITMINTKFVDNIIKRTLNEFIFDKFDKICDEKRSFKPLTFCQNVAFNTMFCAIFGENNLDFNGKAFNEYRNLIEEYMRTVLPLFFIHVFFGDFGNKSTDWLLSKSNLWGNHKNGREKLNDITLKYYKQTIAGGIQSTSPCFAEYMNKRSDLTENEIICDLWAMIISGFAATANTLCTAILYLAKYPKIQQELYEELNSINIKHGHGGIQFDKLHKLKAYFYELTRLYSSVVIPFRILQKDIDIDEYHLKKGTIVMYSPYAMGRNSKYLNVSHVNMKQIDLNEVNLNLWIDPKNGKFIHLNKRNIKYFPFSVGMRDCPGQSIAIKQVLISLAMFISKYEIFKEKDQKFNINFDTKTAFQVVNHSSVYLKKRN